jgi:hypothetical protein
MTILKLTPEGRRYVARELARKDKHYQRVRYHDDGERYIDYVEDAISDRVNNGHDAFYEIDESNTIELLPKHYDLYNLGEIL